MKHFYLRNSIIRCIPELWMKSPVPTRDKIQVTARNFSTKKLADYQLEEIKETQKKFSEQLNKLLETARTDKKQTLAADFNEFSNLFSRFLTEEQTITWNKLEKLPEDAVRNYSGLQAPSEVETKDLLSKLVVVKLNGGLGTSMGCKGPKSLIVVRNNLTFLHLTIEQLVHLNEKYRVNVPLVLMNSFNTDDDTHKVMQEFGDKLKIEIHTFNQSAYPRIDRESYKPMPKVADIQKNKDAWYPPGHGDFYTSFKNCGLLDKYIKEGRTVCFVSNIDNLGATVDLNILKLIINQTGKKSEFIMEVTEKTKADIKGGTLMQYEGRTGLLEIAQVPKGHEKDFKDIKVFKYFNTNNLWIELAAIDRVVKEKKLNMEVIANDKEMKDGTKVYQLEIAMGAAMKSFNGAFGLNTPRSRFLPVKKTSDLLLVQSNLYELKNGTLVMSPKRIFPTVPILKLGDEHFKKVDKFQKRFESIPNIVELDHLTVSGDVVFGKNVTLKGTVILIANYGNRIHIPNGAILEDKVVSGNLRILKSLDF